jgi:hypothetical protein
VHQAEYQALGSSKLIFCCPSWHQYCSCQLIHSKVIQKRKSPNSELQQTTDTCKLEQPQVLPAANALLLLCMLPLDTILCKYHTI